MNFFNYSNKSYSFERDALIGIILMMIPMYFIRNFRVIMIALYIIYFGYTTINLISFLKTRKHIDTYTKIICICGIILSITITGTIIYTIVR